MSPPQWNTSQPTFCGCVSWYGWAAPDCQSLAPAGYVHAALGVLNLAVAVLALPWALYLLIGGARATKRRLNSYMNANIMTLLYSTGGLLCAIAAHGFILYNQLTPSAWVVLPGGIKNTTMDLGENIAVTLLSMFACFAGMHISLAWIDVSQRVAKLSRYTTKAEWWRKSVYSCEALFFLVLATLAALDLWAYAAVISIPILLAIIVCYSFAAYRMRSVVLQEASGRLSQNSPQGGDASAQESKMKSVAKGIYVCAVRVVSLMLGTLVSITVFGVISAGTGGWRAQTPDNADFRPAVVATFVFLLCLELILVSLVAYLAPINLSLIRGGGKSGQVSAEPEAGDESVDSSAAISAQVRASDLR